ncbi:glycosyltransferase family 2 protein, partial [Devosia sp.]|uniref:glycosyltransferase family 2 protein n=1 Tax=Devosia sp. TaxID=1871048 RepID=UPI0032663A07
QRLARRWPFATAHLASTFPVRLVFVIGLLITVSLVLVSPFLPHPVLLPLALLLIALPAMLSLAAIMELRSRPAPPPDWSTDDAELPIYSVLIPLRDEAHMVPQLAQAMLALDYPAARLDIKFVVEARSAHTVAAVHAALNHAQFSLVCVPDAMPRTKPKALDFALPLCRGEYVVVFDAEDRPEPSQLRYAALRFRQRPAVHCIQAELVIDNAREAPLAALFAGEYAGLFGVKLPALARWGLPVPLGGTSNHFRTATLREIGGWDAYNVTEDADLGVRLARLRLKVETIPVATFEAAPTTLRSWLSQRTRWMKGWMQTFIVHNRHPWRALAEMGWWPFLAFEVMALGQILAPLLHTGFLLLNLARLALNLSLLGPLEADWPLLYPAMFLFGYAAAVLLTLAGLFRLRGQRPVLVQLLLPIYWLLISLATLLALLDLLKRPFYWAKTTHQLTLNAEPPSPLGQSRRPLR